jgi:hypothetical protein
MLCHPFKAGHETSKCAERRVDVQPGAVAVAELSKSRRLGGECARVHL